MECEQNEKIGAKRDEGTENRTVDRIEILT